MLIAFNVTEISKYDLRPAVFKFLVPQKIEDSTTVTWLYTNNAIFQTFFQGEINV